MKAREIQSNALPPFLKDCDYTPMAIYIYIQVDHEKIKELVNCDSSRTQKAGNGEEDTTFLNRMVSKWGTYFGESSAVTTLFHF